MACFRRGPTKRPSRLSFDRVLAFGQCLTVARVPDTDAPKAEREKARAKTEAVLAAVKMDPSKFAEIAKKTGGRRLGRQGRGPRLFRRGAMVKPFEVADYGLKAAEVSGVAESDIRCANRPCGGGGQAPRPVAWR